MDAGNGVAMPYKDAAAKRAWNRRDKAKNADRYRRYEARSLEKWRNERAPLCACGCRQRIRNRGCAYILSHSPPSPGGPLGIDRSTPASWRITIRSLYWAAGFLEGEGSFPIRATGCECVSASQVQRAPLDTLQSLFGGSVTLHRRNDPKRRRCKQIYNWRVTGPRARGLMLTLYSLMSPRRQAQITRPFFRLRVLAH